MTTASYPIDRIRQDFPLLERRVHNKPLVYLDNAATTQKPRAVLEAIDHYYTFLNSNIHRGVHTLSELATKEYEAVRTKTARFLHAADSREIIFVRGATEAINLVAQTFGRMRISAGDEMIVSAMEHHSNIVPWQMLCEEKHAHLRVLPMDDTGELQLDKLAPLLTPRTRLVCVTQISNALGTVNPVKEITTMAHRQGIPVLVDGAQAAPHLPIDVRDLGCDFYAFSGHKLYGPTGIGALWGRLDLLEAMPPYQGGGEMILSVSFEKTTYNKVPHKFEAGTPHISGVIGLGAAIDYLSHVGWEALTSHEHDLLTYATAALRDLPELRIVGTAREKAGVISFVMEGIHPHDIGTILDREGIAIRTGHHCAQPVMERFGIPATARASFALYNTRQDVDALVSTLHKVKEVFA